MEADPPASGRPDRAIRPEADPDEATGLAGKPEHAAKVKELLAPLEAERKRYGDKIPLTAEKPLPAEWTPPKKGKK